MPGSFLYHILNVVVVYGALVGGMYYFQDRFIYLPEADPLRPEAYGLNDFSALPLHTQDGETLMSWWRAPQPGYPVLVYFHGNAGHLGSRADKLRAFADQGFGVLGVSWRGYGASSGIPSEQGLYEDARTAIHYALEELKIPLASLVLYGESLGSGVAVQMGTEYDVGGMVLEAPYTSVVQRASEKFPFLPVGWMLKSRFDSLSKTKKLAMPVLILHGEADAVIPIAHGRTLLEALPEPKKALFFPGIGHNDFSIPRLAEELSVFSHEQGLHHILPAAPQPEAH